MARAKSRKTKVLEWISIDGPKLAGSGITLRAMNLQLDDDELAEVWKIESEIDPILPAAFLDDILHFAQALMTDPSYSIASGPYVAAVYEDMEQCFSHQVNIQLDVDAVAANVNILSQIDRCKTWDAPAGLPILLATNPAVLQIDDATVDVNYSMRVYFTRRKATDFELARTLLKRR